MGLPEMNTRFRTNRIKAGSESERRRIQTYPETLPFSGPTQYSVNICECCRMPIGKHVTADQRSSYLTADADAQRKQDLRRQGIRKTVPSPRAADGKKEQLLPECDPAHQTGQTQPGRNRRMGVSEEKISRQKKGNCSQVQIRTRHTKMITRF